MVNSANLPNAFQPHSADSPADNRWLILFAHDVRKPIARLISTLHLLNDMLTAQDYDGVEMVMNIALDSGEDLQRMLSDLPFQPRTELSTTPTQLVPLVERVVYSFQESAHAAGVSLGSTMPADVPLLQIPSSQLMRVLNNLIDNAIRYAPNSAVQVVVSPLILEANGVRLLQVGVLDNGAGIHPLLHRSIFDYFFRVVDQKEPDGYGLGLPFCKWIVEQNGGQIWVESTLGEGSAFWFTVPIYPLSSGTAPESEP